MNVYVAPPFVWLIFAGVVAYLAALGHLMRYLKTAQRAVWEELGEPTLFLNNSIRNGWLTLKYVFSSEHRVLNDKSLTAQIWTVRGLFGGVTVMWIVGIVWGWIPAR